MFGKRILILVPHPDDEVVACCAAISRAQETRAQIFALYLTHGCIAQETLWPWQRKNYFQYIGTRQSEAEQVARFLGITPIGWNPRPARHLWREMENVQKEVAKAIKDQNVDQLWVPAYEGGNADHDALNAIGQTFKTKIRVLEFAEYNFFEGKTHSQAFPYPNGTEQILHLTEAEQKKKRDALSLYQSEQQNLNYVDVKQESFRPLGTYSYDQPPHPGTLWYERFQWVPFKHPRVDFTKPEEVSAAIRDFLKSHN